MDDFTILYNYKYIQSMMIFVRLKFWAAIILDNFAKILHIRTIEIWADKVYEPNKVLYTLVV